MRRLQLTGSRAASVAALIACFAMGCLPGSNADAETIATVNAKAAESREAITATLERYMIASRAVDAATVATFFAPTGELFEPGIAPIVGPDSIRAFMSSFPGVRIDVATATADTIEVFGNTALLWGKYFEKLAFPGQPDSEQHGKFVIEWVRSKDAWFIQKYYRIPLPAAAAPMANIKK